MRGMCPPRLVFAAALVAALGSAFNVAADIVILRNDGTPATSDQVVKWQDSQGKWHIVLQALYAPGGVTLYEIRGNGGETIERVIIHVPCWKGPNGQCVPAGSPVFVRVMSDPPLGVQSVNQIVQTGTAETLLTHVIVNEDIGSISVEAIGILQAGRDILGPVTATTPENPNRGIGSVSAERHILGDLSAMKGRIGIVYAAGKIGLPNQPIHISFKHNSLDLKAEEVHAHIDTRIPGGNGHLWRLEADRFFGTLQTPYIGHHYQTGAPGSIRVHEQMAGVLEIGGSFDDPDHLIELPVGGVEGQVVINAHNGGGVWTAPIHFGSPGDAGHASLTGPTYSAPSAEIGGGAIGVVPFRLHHASSSPPSGSTVTLKPDDPSPVVDLDHYGAIRWTAGDPVLIERRPLEGGPFELVSLDQFDVELSLSNPRALRLSNFGDAAGFDVGFEYRISAKPELRSDAAGQPAVVWSQPYLIAFEAEGGEPDEPGDPGVPSQPTDPEPPICIGDLNSDGVVNVFDLLILLSKWGPCVSCPADLDGNGSVNVFDLLLLLSKWGPC